MKPPEILPIADSPVNIGCLSFWSYNPLRGRFLSDALDRGSREQSSSTCAVYPHSYITRNT